MLRIHFRALSLVLLLVLSVAGCDWLPRDRVPSGYYRAETHGVEGCAFAVTAVLLSKRLFVTGRLRGYSDPTPLSGEVTVSLLEPSGARTETRKALLTNVAVDGTGINQVKFATEFDRDAPRGTLISVIPRLSLCLPLKGMPNS
jgi:hypothetical protein